MSGIEPSGFFFLRLCGDDDDSGALDAGGRDDTGQERPG